MTNPRPVSESSCRGKSRSAMYIFVRPIFDLVFLKTGENVVSTKMYMADLNSSRRAVFVGYLGSAVALTVPLEINFNCFSATYKLKTITYRFPPGNVVRKPFFAGS